MTVADAVNAWVIALLKNLFPGQTVQQWEEDMPAQVGYFVNVGQEDVGDHDHLTYEVTIRIVGTGKTGARTMIETTRLGLHRLAGAGDPWAVLPTTIDPKFRVKQCKYETTIGPEKDGPLATTWAGTSTYTVRAVMVPA